MTRALISTFPGQEQDAIIVACPATNLSGQSRLRLPATELSAGPEIGIPRGRMVLALGSHGLQLWKAGGGSKPRFHAGSIPEDFVVRVDFVRDDRPLFGRHELLLHLADGVKLRLGVHRKHRSDAEELAMRLSPTP